MSAAYWIFVFLTLGLIGFVGYGTFRTADLLREWRPEGNALLMPMDVIFRLVLLLVCVALGLLSGVDRATLGWQAPHLREQVTWGAAWGALMALIAVSVTHFLVRRTGERFYSSVIIELIVPKNAREAFLVLLALVPVVVLEELLFRSLFIGGLSLLLPVAMLVICGGAMFGLLHSPQGIWGMIGAALGGLAFGWLFVAWESLVAPTVAHYVANVAQIGVAMWLLRNEPDKRAANQSAGSSSTLSPSSSSRSLSGDSEREASAGKDEGEA